jgi:beta-glucosidase
MGSDIYRDSARTLDERVRDLVARMTVDEKVAQLAGVWPPEIVTGGAFDAGRAERAIPHGIGHISHIAAVLAQEPGDLARTLNEAQRWLIERTRLGIPAIVHGESLAGFTGRGGTVFPQAIGLASTWDPALVEEMGGVIRRQMRGVGIHQTLAPVLDIARDARWGRCEETYGEDPYLAGEMGTAYVRGVQGGDLREGVVATGKHFIGYGASEGGMNWAPAHIGPRELREVYAVSFERAIRDGGIASMMNSYGEIDGVPAGVSREILTDLLRGELGFDGVVVSDYFTVPTVGSYHRATATRAEGAARALAAGLDVELPFLASFRALPEALEKGMIDMPTLDAAVSRVLRMKFQLGLFEQPYVDAHAAVTVMDTADDRALSRRIAERSIVLLKNDGVLPIGDGVRRIALMGPHADSRRLLQGDYHYPAHCEGMHGPVREEHDDTVTDEAARVLTAGDARVDLTDHFVPHVTLLEGIRRRAGEGAAVTYARGCGILGTDTAGFDEAVRNAREADIAVVCVGTKSGMVPGCTSGESNDRSGLGLPGVQQQLVEAVVATGTPTVVVLVNGGILAIPWIAEHAPAVVEAWLPGEEAGNALAPVLFGDVDAGGRLPVSLPRSAGHVPVFYNHKPSGGRSNWRGDYADAPVAPVFAFGHGLSYTSFEYGALALGATELDVHDTLEAAVDVTNSGARAGDEVVQLYVRDLVASVTRPVMQLAGFARVALEPGKTVRVTFTLDLTQLAFYDERMRFVVEPGAVEVMVGRSSTDIRSREVVTITGAVREVRRDEVRTTRVAVS